MTDPDPTTQMKALSRQRLRQLWQIAQMGGEQNDEDRRIAEAMRDHPEYAHLWPRLDQLTDAEITADGVNPILHITFHATVENQLALGDPPEVGQTIAALERRGLPHHEAVHRVAWALVDELWNMMHEQQPFDPARYAAKLAELLRSRPAHRKSPTRSEKHSTKRRR